MAGVRAGGDRQVLHERLRVHAWEAARRVKEEGVNPLLDLIGADPAFSAIADGLGELLDPARFVGRAPAQVSEFLSSEVEPRLAGFAGDEEPDELRV